MFQDLDSRFRGNDGREDFEFPRSHAPAWEREKDVEECNATNSPPSEGWPRSGRGGFFLVPMLKAVAELGNGNSAYSFSRPFS